MPASEVRCRLSGLLGRTIISMDRIYGGRNSRLYRLTCTDSQYYAAKLYMGEDPSARARLDTEYTSLEYLRSNGLDCVPGPVAVDKAQGCAVYEYVEGQKISSSEVTPSDIDDAVDFLMRLKELSRRPGSEQLPRASDACFSVHEGFAGISARLNQLMGLPKSGPQYLALHSFLEEEFSPALVGIREWCESTLASLGMSPESQVAGAELTLSPSDFGFHNALRRNTGQIVYLDFEYFGWDDPAKMTSDFLLHPAMELGESLKRRFVANILNGFAAHEELQLRLEITYPLHGLKWCLLVLNEFVPQKLIRRGFAEKTLPETEELQSLQLSKARNILERVKLEYQQFPYNR